MPMLTHWFGLFGSKLEEKWEDEHPAEAALDRYMESRRYCEQMFRKYPRAAVMIREIDLETTGNTSGECSSSVRLKSSSSSRIYDGQEKDKSLRVYITSTTVMILGNITGVTIEIFQDMNVMSDEEYTARNSVQATRKAIFEVLGLFPTGRRKTPRSIRRR